MKLGAGITSAVITGLLSLAGYVSSQAGAAGQPESAMNMIVDIYKYGPMIVWIVVIITLLFYKLDKQYPKIMEELMEREARGEL